MHGGGPLSTRRLRKARARRGDRAPALVAAAVVLLVAAQVWRSRTGSTQLTISPDAVGRGALQLDPGRGATGAATHADLWPGGGLVAPSTTAAATTVPALPAAPTVSLPVPDLLPADPYADSPEQVIGRITIPALGIDEALQQGMTLTAINRGPSHWPGTAEPGQLGNVVVAGHRTTYSRPFHDLDQLQPGDEVVYTTDRGTFRYAVAGTEIVDPSQVGIADQQVGFTSTLFACHPPGSAAQRIVVHLQLVGDDGRPVAPPDLALVPVTVPRP